MFLLGESKAEDSEEFADDFIKVRIQSLIHALKNLTFQFTPVTHMVYLKIRLHYLDFAIEKLTSSNWISKYTMCVTGVNWKVKFLSACNNPFLFKGLSIESDNKVMGMVFWRFLGIKGIRDNILGLSLYKNKRWEDIQWILCPCGPRSSLPHCICSRSNPRLVETGQWGFYQGDIVLYPPFSLYFNTNGRETLLLTTSE